MIKDNVKNILEGLPKGVELVAATKTRTVGEIEEAIGAGVKIIGENYIREAEEKFLHLGHKVKWHLIGHLQKNKAKRAIKIFDMVETLDSLKLAATLNRECEKINKVMPVLIEVNSACEPSKYGILPKDVEGFIKELVAFANLKPMGLMTMGPFLDDPESLRPYFRKTKEIFENIKSLYGNRLDWAYLSMGMSIGYGVAVEEGANIVRVGTAIFGERREG